MFMKILELNKPKTQYSLNKNHIGVEELNVETEKITLPKEIQKGMIDFFLKTSIPRIKQKKQQLLSENKTDRGDEK